MISTRITFKDLIEYLRSKGLEIDDSVYDIVIRSSLREPVDIVLSLRGDDRWL